MSFWSILLNLLLKPLPLMLLGTLLGLFTFLGWQVHRQLREEMSEKVRFANRVRVAFGSVSLVLALFLDLFWHWAYGTKRISLGLTLALVIPTVLLFVMGLTALFRFQYGEAPIGLNKPTA